MLNRRHFIRLGAGFAGAVTLGAGHSTNAAVKRYNEFPDKPLTLLTDDKGQAFSYQSGQFVLAYFGTAHLMYKGCDSQLLEIENTVREARSQYGINVLPVLVFPPNTEGKAPVIYESYVKNGLFTGLSGDQNTVAHVGAAHKAFYTFKDGDVSAHNQSAILIGPRGDLLRKYSKDTMNYYDIAQNIRSLARERAFATTHTPAP